MQFHGLVGSTSDLIDRLSSRSSPSKQLIGGKTIPSFMTKYSSSTTPVVEVEEYTPTRDVPTKFEPLPLPVADRPPPEPQVVRYVPQIPLTTIVLVIICGLLCYAMYRLINSQKKVDAMIETLVYKAMELKKV